jgi:hypothetical protein
MENKEIDLTAFLSLIYRKVFYLVIIFIISFTVSLIYFFFYNEKLYKSEISIIKYSDSELYKWIYSNEVFFDNYSFITQTSENDASFSINKYNINYDIIKYFEHSNVLLNDLVDANFDLDSLINNIKDKKNINKFIFLSKIISSLKIETKGDSLLVSIISKNKEDIYTVYNLIKSVKEIMILNYSNLIMQEYNHKLQVLFLNSIKGFYSDFYTGIKAKEYKEHNEEYIDWLKSLELNEENFTGLNNKNFNLFSSNIHNEDINSINSINFYLIMVISLIVSLLIFIFYLLFYIAINNKT